MSFEVADTKVLVATLRDIAGAIDAAASKNAKALHSVYDMLKLLNENLVDLREEIKHHD